MRGRRAYLPKWNSVVQGQIWKSSALKDWGRRISVVQRLVGGRGDGKGERERRVFSPHEELSWGGSLREGLILLRKRRLDWKGRETF